MSTGTPFVPTQFTTTQVAPKVANGLRSVSYITLAEYKFAPTAVSVQRLVNGSSNPSSDADASLAQVIARASTWVDWICFKAPIGCLAARNTVESDRVKLKPDGALELICNLKPVNEVTGLAMGMDPSVLANATQTIAQSLWIDERIIRVPNTWQTFPTPQPATGYMTDGTGHIYVVWSYVSGYPNFALSATANKGATSLTLQPAVPTDTTLYGIYAGTPLTIVDGANTETVVASGPPNGLTVNLEGGTLSAHTLPGSPNWIRVHAMPNSIAQATIFLTNVLIKAQGFGAQVMPATPGGQPNKQAMGMAGAMGDYQKACELLRDLEVVVLR